MKTVIAMAEPPNSNLRRSRLQWVAQTLASYAGQMTGVLNRTRALKRK